MGPRAVATAEVFETSRLKTQEKCDEDPFCRGQLHDMRIISGKSRSKPHRLDQNGEGFDSQLMTAACSLTKQVSGPESRQNRGVRTSHT